MRLLLNRFLRQSFAWSLIFFVLLQGGCASRRPVVQQDLLQETWMRQIETNADAWTRGADNWFLSGRANLTEKELRHAPNSALVSTMMVRVPAFTNIKVKGDFQVQIFGTEQQDSVYIYGTNEAVSATNVRVQAGVLCVDQIRPAPGMDHVIVRIGVRHLERLIQAGHGSIEGVQLHGYHMEVISLASGPIYLGGQLDVRYVENSGRGDMHLFGVRTPDLSIKTSGCGVTTLCGQMAVHSIMHSGVGNISMIGANSNHLNIYVSGAGKISIVGPVNLGDVVARGEAGVYICDSRSRAIRACVYDDAAIGIAGAVGNLTVEAQKRSCFAGRRLFAETVFARATEDAHISVFARNKVFASATGYGSVYVGGHPFIHSEFKGGNGVVIYL
ncbi:MAG TPA: DUF2807 domain-containing protein [Gammaproteobacteria bacterium]|jgi:hypothetical protein|nr:DUF2807 domain-containing protein [Gammaproteobacteria bacterium]